MQKGDVLNIKKRTERERDIAREEKRGRERRGRKGNERWREDEDVSDVLADGWIMVKSSLTWHSSQHRT